MVNRSFSRYLSYIVTTIIYSLLSRKDRLSPYFMSNKGTTEKSLLYTYIVAIVCGHWTIHLSSTREI